MIMPKFDNMQTHTVPGSQFQFSAIRPDKLGASEYTLVTIVVDVSGSVQAFSRELLQSIQSVIAACQRSPRADNLMVRLLSFNDQRREIHGFIPLHQIDASTYQPLQCHGSTALYDAVYDAVGATNVYAKTLFDQDFDVNAAVYIITDGEDNCSAMTPDMIARQVEEALRREYLESLITILVGVNTANGASAGYLQLFKDEAKLTQFIDIANATSATLAKLAAFVDKSIRAQSQALGSGTIAHHLTF
jgi:uncharacterized protein YegL